MSADHDDGLTVAEAAASTGYSLGMIRTWIRQGTLPARQVPGHGYHGHQYRIDPADLARWSLTVAAIRWLTRSGGRSNSTPTSSPSPLTTRSG